MDSTNLYLNDIIHESYTLYNSCKTLNYIEQRTNEGSDLVMEFGNVCCYLNQMSVWCHIQVNANHNMSQS